MRSGKETLLARIMPVLEHTARERKESLSRVMVPVFNSKYRMGMVLNLQECVQSEGQALLEELEKGVALHVMDICWKEHLREMDDLKQSVQNVVYEQKDPLLIYKFESYELFEKLLHRINTETLGFLLNAEIPLPEEANLGEAQSASLPRHSPRLKESKAEVSGSNDVAPNRASFGKERAEKSAPVRAEKVAKRNDKVTVRYEDGTLKEGVKYKKVEEDIRQNLCVLVKVDEK